MQFNSYIWGLYAESQEGKRSIRFFNDFLYDARFYSQKNENFSLFEAIDWDFVHDAHDIIESYADSQGMEPALLFDALAHHSLLGDIVNDEYLMDYLVEITICLSAIMPEDFIPYFFIGRFDELQNICSYFSIPIPDVPGKLKKTKRFEFYYELCKVFKEYRLNYSLSPVEFYSFLYGFAPHMNKEVEENQLPNALKVWIVGAGINNNGDIDLLDGVDETTVVTWQGHQDMRRGDIVLMYCLSPHSCIHSIWRVQSHGFTDPFRYFYSQVRLCSPIKTVPVTYQELRGHPLLKSNPLVRASMQGVNGKRFTSHEYEAILEIMQEKGQNVSILPRLVETYNTEDNVNKLLNERDVEIFLLEPLLVKLGFTNTDWKRQMVLRMGQGEKRYADYAFFPKFTKGEEQALMLIETKYRIRTSNDLYKAYCQAKSYALRLEADRFIVASVEGLWIFQREESGFSFETNTYMSWIQLAQPDCFSDFYKMVGRESLQSNRLRASKKKGMPVISH